MYRLLFNIQKHNVYVIFIFVYNSLISVMLYKIYNELSGVWNGAKSLISEIYHNVYSNTPHLTASRHQERRKGAPAATLHT